MNSWPVKDVALRPRSRRATLVSGPQLSTESKARRGSICAFIGPYHQQRSTVFLEVSCQHRGALTIGSQRHVQLVAVLGKDDAERGWAAVAADLAVRGIPITTQSLWAIVLLRGRRDGDGADAPGTAHVIVLYDHTVGDGASVPRVFADWLAAATRDISASLPFTPRPLVASLTRIARTRGPVAVQWTPQDIEAAKALVRLSARPPPHPLW